MKKVTVVSIGGCYPDGVPVPIQTLVKVLLNNRYAVNLISGGQQELSEDILTHPQYTGFEVPKKKDDSIAEKIRYRCKLRHFVRKKVEECMRDSDYLWTATIGGIREVGKLALRYKHILELLELEKNGYYYKQWIKFRVDRYAVHAWKNVVVELNRAYIQQVWWDLRERPCVLPNKPYDLDFGEMTPELDVAIRKMKEEKRTIVLYLGGIYPDRNFEECAKAIKDSKKYVLYIVGPVPSSAEEQLQDLIREYSAVYLGGFAPPKHLALVKYARIGLLPYKPVKILGISELNTLYCAPNKIFEYAGFGVPMVGSDVLGLRLPFEQWEIGRCCNFNDAASIIQAIEAVDEAHDEMSANCRSFYDSVNLSKIVREILEEE